MKPGIPAAAEKRSQKQKWRWQAQRLNALTPFRIAIPSYLGLTCFGFLPVKGKVPSYAPLGFAATLKEGSFGEAKTDAPKI